MKTKEEIEQLAEKYFPDPYICTGKEGFIEGYTQCQEDMAISFAEWLNDTGWIRRPFEEKSGIYLYDDHSEDNFNYNKPKSIKELYSQFINSNKQD